MTKEQKAPIRRKRRKNKSGIGYILLFTFVFLFALWGLSYLVKSYSPDVDVAIGNSETLILNETDTEIRTVDERLKWIKMEDELPTVSVKVQKDDKNQDKTSRSKKEKEDKKKQEEIENSEKLIAEKEKQQLDFAIKSIQESRLSLQSQLTNITQEQQKPKITKVYIGQYSSIEDAIRMQHKVTLEAPETTPFIKSINGNYVVQIGSFVDKDKAIALVTTMSEKGFSARAVSEK